MNDQPNQSQQARDDGGRPTEAPGVAVCKYDCLDRMIEMRTPREFICETFRYDKASKSPASS